MDNQSIGAVKTVLLTDLPDLNAPAKHLLCKIIWLYGDGVVDRNLHELQVELGVSRNTIIKARDSLLGVGNASKGWSSYLIQEVVPGKSGRPVGRVLKGRPRKGFRLSPGFRDWLIEEQSMARALSIGGLHFNNGVLRWLIQDRACQSVRTVEGKKLPNRKAMASNLGWDNRYLLALLWVLANPLGVISGIGVSAIAKKAGMSKDQVEGQLTKLVRLGYIRHQTGGVSSGKLFGRKAGDIFLDRLHPSFVAMDEGSIWERFPVSLAEGALGVLNQAFFDAKNIEKLEVEVRRIKARLEEVNEDLDADRVSRLHGRLEEAEYHFQERVRSFDRGVILRWESGEADDLQGTPPTGLFRAFLKSGRTIKAYAELIVCRYASRMVVALTGQEKEVDEMILGEIIKDVCPKARLENEQWGRALGLWFYGISEALAVELRGIIASKLDFCVKEIEGGGSLIGLTRGISEGGDSDRRPSRFRQG